jgi:uncharacterized protein YgbK (DUF1537 family)
MAGSRPAGTSQTASHVLAITTNSRSDEPALAAGKVARAVADLPPHDLLYKKIDSVLRGNTYAEIAALGERPAIACSAFPDQGRVVQAGVAHPPGIDLRSVLPPWVEIRDAATNAELDDIAADALLRTPTPLLIGSAGLARAVARLIRPIPPLEPFVPGHATVVLAIGSTSETTREQIAWLLQHLPRNFILYEIDVRQPRPGQLSLLKDDLARRRDGGLILSGGDTALLVCDLLGVSAIALEREVLPGMPLGRLVGGVADGLAVITKSGGFGAPDALACAVDVLSAHNRENVAST